MNYITSAQSEQELNHLVEHKATIMATEMDDTYEERMDLSEQQVDNNDQHKVNNNNNLLQMGVLAQIDGTTQPTQVNGDDILQVAIQ